MTKLERFITSFLTTWQGRLGLSDWDIIWSWVSQAEINELIGYAADAAVTADLNKLSTHIYLNQEAEWQHTNPLAPLSIQEVLLHELIHVRLSFPQHLLFGIKELSRPYLPQAAQESVADLLVKIRESYVDSLVAILLSQEPLWKSKK